MNLCVDCRFYEKQTRREPGCARTAKEKVRPVDGSISRQLEDCWEERFHNGAWLFGRPHCGPLGRFFEPKGAA